MGVLDTEGCCASKGCAFSADWSEEDMCLALDKKYKEKEVTGAIEAYRDCGTSDEDIIERVVKKFNVTKEYVLALLAPQKV